MARRKACLWFPSSCLLVCTWNRTTRKGILCGPLTSILDMTPSHMEKGMFVTPMVTKQKRQTLWNVALCLHPRKHAYWWSLLVSVSIFLDLLFRFSLSLVEWSFTSSSLKHRWYCTLPWTPSIPQFMSPFESKICLSRASNVSSLMAFAFIFRRSHNFLM